MRIVWFWPVLLKARQINENVQGQQRTTLPGVQIRITIQEKVWGLGLTFLALLGLWEVSGSGWAVLADRSPGLKIQAAPCIRRPTVSEMLAVRDFAWTIISSWLILQKHFFIMASTILREGLRLTERDGMLLST